MFDLDAAGLSALAGMVLSLVFGYLPWVKDWFEGLDSRIKPLLNIGVLLLVAWGYTAFKCQFDLDCLGANAGTVFAVWMTAVLANMATYTGAVRQMKQAERKARAK